MKKILWAMMMVGLSSVVGTSAQASLFLTCHSSPSVDREGPDANVQEFDLFLYGAMRADCRSGHGKKYAIAFDGFGPGLRIAKSAFTIFCPTVSKKRIHQNRGVGIAALRVAGSALIGMNAGVGLNLSGGVCAMIGVEAGVGVGAHIGLMTIHEGTVRSNRLGDLE